jgi:hypothetical protein
MALVDNTYQLVKERDYEGGGVGEGGDCRLDAGPLEHHKAQSVKNLHTEFIFICFYDNARPYERLKNIVP